VIPIEQKLRCRNEAISGAKAMLEENWDAIWESWQIAKLAAEEDNKVTAMKYGVGLKVEMRPKLQDVIIKASVRFGVTRTDETDSSIIEKEPHPELPMDQE